MVGNMSEAQSVILRRVMVRMVMVVVVVMSVHVG